MKIARAKQLYSDQLNTLWNRKRALSSLLQESENRGVFSGLDRVEISRQLSEADAQYKAAQSIMESIQTQENLIHDAEVARQQSRVMAKAAEDIGKMMEVYRRIASGATVPAKDEKKLMEYNHELYMAAKAAAMLARQSDEEYDSLWKDEEESSGEERSPGEIAGDSEISVPIPESVAAEAAEQLC